MNMSLKKREGIEEGRWTQMEGEEWKSRVMEKAGEEDGKRRRRGKRKVRGEIRKE